MQKQGLCIGHPNYRVDLDDAVSFLRQKLDIVPEKIAEFMATTSLAMEKLIEGEVFILDV